MYIGSWKIAYLALSNNYSSDLEISNFKQHTWCCLRIKMSLALMLPFKWHSHPSMSKPFLWTYICCFHMSVLSKTTGVGVKSGVMIYIIVENLRQRFGSSYCHVWCICFYWNTKIEIICWIVLIFCVNLKFEML